MKKITLLSLAMLTLALNSCSKDDSTTTPAETGPTIDDNAINEQEETVLNADSVTKGLVIEGAQKVQGAPPTPNGAISFDLGYDKQSAFLKNGFDITFNTSDNYTGAYIQLKSEDGTFASEYIDVPKLGAQKILKNTSGHTSTFGQKASKVDEPTEEIDVDFGADVPPGKFCYVICIYDAEGNIALPQEVCVEIEAWGGNSALSGTWNYTKSESFENGNLIDSELVGIEECNDAFYYCPETQVSETLEDRDCYTTKSLILVLNQDGSFRYDETYDENRLDYEASSENCTPVFINKTDAIDYSKGNWAYNEDTKELTLVEFEYSEDGEVEFYEEGDVFGGTSTVSGNSMIFEYSEESTTTSYSDKTYFVR